MYLVVLASGFLYSINWLWGIGDLLGGLAYDVIALSEELPRHKKPIRTESPTSTILIADSNLPLPTPEINDTVLQIRSISTILSKIFPNAGEGMRAHRDARLRTLDDLSLLFVRGSSDVVAVAVLVANNCITLKTAHTAADEGRLDVVGNGGAES